MSRIPKPSGRNRGKLHSLTFTGVNCPATGKVSYATEFIAKMALARLKAVRPNLKSVYECPHPQCRQWHLTSQEQS